MGKTRDLFKKIRDTEGIFHAKMGTIKDRTGMKQKQNMLRSESESEVAQSCPTLCDPWTVAHQAPLSMGFSRQKVEWVSIFFSRGSSQPRDQIPISFVSCIGRWDLYH